MRYFLTIVLKTILSCSVAQTTAVIKGKITDATTQEALIGASIVLDRKTGVTSDSEGNYIIQVKPGIITLNFQYIGYKSFSKTVEIKPADTLTINVNMEISIKVLDEIVVSAGKFEQKLSDITVSMEIIKPSRIISTNTTSMETIISQMPGVDVMDDQPSIRGGGGYSYGAGSRVLVLVDDLPILSPDAGDAKWNFLPVENITQVEILKGAASVLYGSSALNGVINFRTAFPKIDPETKISVFNGFYLNPRRKELIWWENQPLFAGANFFHSRKIGNLDFVSAANVFSNTGNRENENEKRARFNMNLKYRDKKIKGLSYGVNTNMMCLEKVDFFLWQDADSGAYRQNTEAISELKGIRINIDPNIVYYNEKGDNHSLRTRFFKVRNEYEEEPDKNNKAEIYYGEYKFHKNFKKDLDWTIGISGSYAKIVAELYGDHYSSNTAVFTQLDSKLFKNLKISLGIRLENNMLDDSTTRSKPVFRTGLNYQLAEYTFLRASFGQGYRFPSIAEKYTATSVSSLNIFPNPYLESETGWSAEVGIKQGVKLSNWNGYLDFAAFWTEYQDMIEFTFGMYKPDSVPIITIEHFGFKSLNIGNAKITGVDIILTGEGELFGIPTSILAGYTYINPVDLNFDPTDTTKSSESNILKYRYCHSAKADIEFKYKRFTTGISFIYNSFMVNIDSVFIKPLIGSLILPGFAEYREKHDKGYIVFDHRISYNITKTSKLALISKNIFNKEYMGRPGDIRPPRNIALQYSLNF